VNKQFEIIFGIFSFQIPSILHPIMKLIFIHGFVEDPTIFDEIRKSITVGEQIALNLVNDFAEWKDAPEDLDVQKLALYLISKYKITAQDCIIGHSMGGWIAAYMKQNCGCKAILLASLTNQAKLLSPLTNLTLLKYSVRWGLTQSAGMVRYLKNMYHFPESKQLYDGLIDGLAVMDKKRLFQQLQVLFAKVPALTIMPDLRVHARKDNIVAFPDETFVEVQGDHFSLIYYPREVSEAVLKVLSA
jgi:pimeloyl-ACP methyl ester carboxylesterase